MSNTSLSIYAQAALTFVTSNGCIMLAGEHWHQLFQLLPHAPDGTRAPLPLILAGEHLSTDQQKHIRLVEHIMWAEQYGGIAEISQYLISLPHSAYRPAKA